MDITGSIQAVDTFNGNTHLLVIFIAALLYFHKIVTNIKYHSRLNRTEGNRYIELWNGGFVYAIDEKNWLDETTETTINSLLF